MRNTNRVVLIVLAVVAFLAISGVVLWLNKSGLYGKQYTVVVNVTDSLPSSLHTRSAVLAQTQMVITKRLTDAGIKVENVVTDEASGQLRYTISRVARIQYAQALITEKGGVMFERTYEASEVISSFVDANKILSKLPLDSLWDNNADTASPLWSVLIPPVDANGQIWEGPVVGYAKASDTAVIDWYLARPELKGLFPDDLVLYWGTANFPVKSKQYFSLYAVRTNPSDGSALSGAVIADAKPAWDKTHQPEVDITMTTPGAARWEQLTESMANGFVGGRHVHLAVAIIYNGKVMMAPKVIQKITGGRANITGIATYEEAQLIAYVIKGGSLPVPVSIVSVK